MTDPNIDFDEKIKQTKGSAMHFAPTQVKQNWRKTTTAGGMVRIRDDQRYNSVEKASIYTITPQTAVQTNALSNQSIRFHLFTYGGLYEKLYLRLKITNTSAGAVGFNPIGMIRRVEMQLNSGEIVSTHHRDEIYKDIVLHMSDEDFKTVAPLMQLNDDFTLDTTNTIAAGASKTYYIPIYTFLNLGEVCIDLIKQPFYVNLDIEGATATTGTLTSATLNQIQLIVKGTRVGRPSMLHIKREYDLGIHNRFLEWRSQEEPITLAASTAYDISLRGFNVYCPFLIVTAAPNPRTSANIFAYEDVFETVELLYNNGTSYDISRDADYSKKFHAIEHFHSSAFDNLNMIPFCFAESCSDAVLTGRVSGGMKFDSSAECILRLVTRTGVSGNYFIRVCGPGYGILKLKIVL